MGRRARRRAAAGAGVPARTPSGAAPSRSEEKNAAARAALEPLAEGERPLAVTIGAIVAALLAIGNLVAWLAGLEVRGERQPLLPVAVLAALLLVTAWGMWRARYWAVLGFQALLALTLIFVALTLLLQAGPAQAIIFTAAVLIPGGALFWFLVKAMARIQMPRRR